MKKNIMFGIGMFLAAMLLVSMVFVSAVSAQTDAENIKEIAEHNDKQINNKEKEAINNLTNQPSKQDKEKIEKILRELDKKNKDEISKSIRQAPVEDPIQIILPDTNDVTIQTNQYYNTANGGDKYSSTTGTAVGGADYSLSNRKAREAVLGASGLGWGNAWAWVGQWITMSGSRTVNIAMNGYAQAYAAAVAGGSANTQVKMGIYDATTGTQYDPVIIFDGSAGGAYYTQIDRSFNVGNTYYLEDGHTYLVYLEVSGSEATVGAGYACTDAGPWDGDDWGYVNYNYFTISW